MQTNETRTDRTLDVMIGATVAVALLFPLIPFAVELFR